MKSLAGRSSQATMRIASRGVECRVQRPQIPPKSPIGSRVGKFSGAVCGPRDEPLRRRAQPPKKDHRMLARAVAATPEPDHRCRTDRMIRPPTVQIDRLGPDVACDLRPRQTELPALLFHRAIQGESVELREHHIGTDNSHRL